MKKWLFTIGSIVILAGCYKEAQPDVNSVIIKFFPSAPSAPADGASTVNITAGYPGNTMPGMYNLTFLTTLGLFYDTQKSTTTIGSLRPLPDSTNRDATAILVCPADTGTAIVTVTAVDISRTLKVKFVPALPQSVKLSTSTQFISIAMATTEATLTLALIRSVGIATPGINVQASATDTLGHAVGDFRNGSLVQSDKTGNATLYFSPDLTTYRGKVLLKAWLPASPLLADSLTVTITN